MKKIICLAMAMLLVSAQPICAAEVYVDGQRLDNTFVKNGRTYVQLSELSKYTGYSLEYDSQQKIVSYFDSGKPRPTIRRDTNLFPVGVEELNYGGQREIIKTYEVSETENAKDIPKEPFEQGGYYYTLKDITQSTNVGVDTRPYEETVTIPAASQKVEDILKELPEVKEYSAADGYSGVLRLDVGSIQSGIQGYNSSTYNISETREYPGLSSPDTSLVPKSITVNGRTLSMSNITWRAGSTEAIDYEQLATTYTAVVNYGGTAKKSSVSGYTATAVYRGEISKEIKGKTVYTAYFGGSKIEPKAEPEPIPEPTEAELKSQLKELAKKDKEERKARGEIVIEPAWVLGILGVLLVAAGAVYLIFFKPNVTVYSMVVGYGRVDGKGRMHKIGRARVTKKSTIVNLTKFSSVAATTTFTLMVNSFSAKRLDGVKLTAVFNGNTRDHIITIAEEKKGIEYQIDVSF